MQFCDFLHTRFIINLYFVRVIYLQNMAFCDNRLWLLSHIHNSFVSSDDTGVCEIVLSPETFAEDMIHVAKTNVSKYLFWEL